MKYAILYLSETGNTKQLAEEIYLCLNNRDRTLVNIKETNEIPEADFYFIGFPVHNRTCALEVLDLLDNLEFADIAMFATCGLSPESKYKQHIENGLLPWINCSCNYRGLFICQGSCSEQFRTKLLASAPESVSMLESIFEEGKGHPDDDDFDAIDEFVEDLIGE